MYISSSFWGRTEEEAISKSIIYTHPWSAILFAIVRKAEMTAPCTNALKKKARKIILSFLSFLNSKEERRILSTFLCWISIQAKRKCFSFFTPLILSVNYFLFFFLMFIPNFEMNDNKCPFKPTQPITISIVCQRKHICLLSHSARPFSPPQTQRIKKVVYRQTELLYFHKYMNLNHCRHYSICWD